MNKTDFLSIALLEIINKFYRLLNYTNLKNLNNEKNG